MKYLFLLSGVLLSFLVQSQTTFNHKVVKSISKKMVDFKNANSGFNATIKPVEAPSPNGQSYRAFLMRQKIEQRKIHPLNTNLNNLPLHKTNQTNAPIFTHGTNMYRVFGSGAKSDFVGGSPNDNTMAISNNGILLAGVNSAIWAYDYNTDTIVFPNSAIGLSSIANEGIGGHYYDPKLLYDPEFDRFILVFLKDSEPATSKIVVCFSTTNNPQDPWNVYFLEGNPLNNNRWTDYPALAVTEKDLFITGNLIIPDVTWQVGFDGSVIWQIDKAAGFNGDAQLTMNLFSQVKHNNKFIRNIHPVRGANGIADDFYFLSNRNFDLENDTVFIGKIKGNATDVNATIEVDAIVSDLKYGVPPNGRQADTDTSDPTGGLQTNDARVLGAFLHNNSIQFVANTVNPKTGLSAVYHGTFKNLKASPSLNATIISDPKLDLGYPNIAFTGKQECESQSIIGFNFTSLTDFPGVGSVYCNNNGEYSELIRIKEGENYVDRTNYSPGPYERWGDYFGLQTRFNKPGIVYGTGYFGNAINANATYVFEVVSPDTNAIIGSANMEKKLYPNPTSYEVNMEFYLEKEQRVNVLLTDMKGNIVETLIYNQSCVGASRLVFNISTLSSGTYIARILDQGNNEILTKKFIKN